MARTPKMISEPARMFRAEIDGKMIYADCWSKLQSDTVERWNGFFWEVY